MSDMHVSCPFCHWSGDAEELELPSMTQDGSPVEIDEFGDPLDMDTPLVCPECGETVL